MHSVANPALFQIVKKNDISLSRALLDAIQGNVKNNLADFLYSMPVNDNDPVQGAMLYDLILDNCADYYLYNAEISIINEHAEYICQLLPGTLSIIENGPGPHKTIRRKTLPLLSAIKNLERYVAIDQCHAYAELAGNYIKFNFPKAKVESIEGDQFDINLNYSYYENPFMICFGPALLNTDPLGHENIADSVSRLMGVWARQLGLRGHLLIAQDTNQDKASLLKAYRNSWNENFNRSLLHRLGRDLPLRGWNVSSWDYSVVWDASNSRVDIGFTANDDHVFMLDQTPVKVTKGQYLHIVSSYKLPADRFLEAAKAGGFEPVRIFTQPGNPVALHLLKVAE